MEFNHRLYSAEAAHLSRMRRALEEIDDAAVNEGIRQLTVAIAFECVYTRLCAIADIEWGQVVPDHPERRKLLFRQMSRLGWADDVRALALHFHAQGIFEEIVFARLEYARS